MWNKYDTELSFLIIVLKLLPEFHDYIAPLLVFDKLADCISSFTEWMLPFSTFITGFIVMVELLTGLMRHGSVYPRQWDGTWGPGVYGEQGSSGGWSVTAPSGGFYLDKIISLIRETRCFIPQTPGISESRSSDWYPHSFCRNFRENGTRPRPLPASASVTPRRPK